MTTMAMALGAVTLTVPNLSEAAAEAASGNQPVLEEVIVTATKRAEPLQDVPISITALTAQDIQARGFTQFGDYLDTIPGVYFEDGGVGDSIVHIRGGTEVGIGSTVATYFGEALTSLFANHGGKPNFEMVDIDRVEVLRGPQGTLFGADALVGVLRIIPAEPDPTRFSADVDTRGYATAHSQDGSYHFDGVVNFPLVQDTLALRLVGYSDRVAGFLDNIVPAQPALDYSAGLGLPPGSLVRPAITALRRDDVNSEDIWGTRATLQWRPVEGLHVDLGFMLQDEKLNGEPQTWAGAGSYAQQRILDQYQQGEQRERDSLTTLVMSYDWDKVSVLSAGNYTTIQRLSVQDVSFFGPQLGTALGAPIPPLPMGYADGSSGRAATEEIRAQSRGTGPLQWTIGLFYLYEDSDISQFVNDFSCPTCLSEVLLQQSFAYAIPKQKISLERQRSVFGEVSYEFLSRWTIGAGGRYLKEDIESINASADGLLNGGPTAAGAPQVGSTSAFNPSAYIRYKPVDATTLYFQASRGFRSAEVNGPYPQTCQDQINQYGVKPITDPDTLWNYELGAKTRLDGGRISIDADVYKENWQKVQLAAPLTSCGFQAIINAGSIDGRGVELGVTAEPSPSLKLNLSFAYNRNRFGTVNAATGYVAGARLPDAPEMNGSFGAQYDFAVGSLWKGFVRADWVYVGNVRINFDPTDYAIQGGFTTLNTRLSFQRGSLAVDLFGNNVTDRRGVDGTNPPSLNGGQFLIRPREVGVELRYSYR